MSETQGGSFSWVSIQTKMGFNSESVFWHIIKGLMPTNFTQTNRNSYSIMEKQPKASKRGNWLIAPWK